MSFSFSTTREVEASTGDFTAYQDCANPNDVYGKLQLAGVAKIMHENKTYAPYLCSMCNACTPVTEKLCCGHSLCLECVQTRLAMAHLQQKNHVELVDCPLCGKHTKLSALERSNKGFSRCFRNTCDARATCKCNTCEKKCCDDCFAKLHELVGDHQKIPIEASIICIIHKESVTLFCTHCNITFCTRCLLSHNPAHAVQPIVDLDPKVTDTLSTETLLDAIAELESNLSMLDEYSQQTIEQIENEYEMALAIVENQRYPTHEAAEQLHITNHEKLAEQLSTLRSTVEYIDHLKDDSPLTIRKMTSIAKLRLHTSQLELAPQVITRVQSSFKYATGTYPPVYCNGQLSWQEVPSATSYRVRAQISPPSKMKLRTGKIEVIIGADSSYSKPGILIYNGSKTSTTLESKYHQSFVFTVETLFADGLSVISAPSVPYNDPAPRANMELRKYKETVDVIVPIMDLTDPIIEVQKIPSRGITKVDMAKSVGTNTTHVVKFPQIGTYHQYRFAPQGVRGDHVPTKFSAPILFHRVNIERASGTPFYTTKGIFEYIRNNALLPAKATSSSKRFGSKDISIVGSGIGEFERYGFGTSNSSLFSTSEDDAYPWVQFDFGKMELCCDAISSSEVVNFSSIVASHDELVWDTCKIETSTGAFGSVVYKLSCNLFYRYYRIIGQEYRPLELRSLVDFYGLLRTPFVFENKFGDEMLVQAKERRFTDLLIKML